MIDRRDQTDMEARDVDRYVGQRLKARRLWTGISHAELARHVDLTFQQIQKYEQGANRISAGRLYEFSRVLDEPVAYFFAGLPGQQCKAERAAEPPLLSSRPMSREMLEIVRLFFEIQDPRLRKQVKSLLRALQTPQIG